MVPFIIEELEAWRGHDVPKATAQEVVQCELGGQSGVNLGLCGSLLLHSTSSFAVF